MSNVCIIPARGGSKRIVKKNIKKFHGKPIIDYPIEAATQSNMFDEIIVSTEDQEIEDHALSRGCTVWHRDQRLAGDHTPVSAVILDALEDVSATYACVLTPTAAFVTDAHINNSFITMTKFAYQDRLGHKISPTTCMAAVVTEHSNRLLREDGFRWLHPVNPFYRNTRTQDMPKAVRDAGCLYWVDVLKFRQNPELWSNRTVAYYINQWRAIDIDTPDDWIMAELVYQALQLRKIKAKLDGKPESFLYEEDDRDYIIDE